MARFLSWEHLTREQIAALRSTPKSPGASTARQLLKQYVAEQLTDDQLKDEVILDLYSYALQQAQASTQMKWPQPLERQRRLASVAARTVLAFLCWQVGAHVCRQGYHELAEAGRNYFFVVGVGFRPRTDIMFLWHTQRSAHSVNQTEADNRAQLCFFQRHTHQP